MAKILIFYNFPSIDIVAFYLIILNFCILKLVISKNRKSKTDELPLIKISIIL